MADDFNAMRFLDGDIVVCVRQSAGKHLDGKNTAGSYSALVVCETGAAPFAGGFYMLPQYHKALDMRQGGALLHPKKKCFILLQNEV